MPDLDEGRLLTHLKSWRAAVKDRGLWNRDNWQDEEAYQEVVGMVKLFCHPLGQMTKYPIQKEEEKWIRIK